jgi:flagellar assembly protein FliH
MSTVIKAGRDFKIVKRLTTIDLADHLAEARKVVSEARTRAKGILAQARQEAVVALQTAKDKGHAEGKTEGHRAGFAAGQAQGLTEARTRFDREQATLRATLEKAVAEFDARKRDLLIEARHDVLALAVALAQRVVKRTAALDSAVATANLEEALRLAARKTDVVVHVHPRDSETMRCFAQDLSTRLAELQHVQVAEDPKLSPGDCVVTAGGTEIDARIETQLNEIVGLLLGGTRPDAVPGAPQAV